jgi:DNA polymerase-3 subunit gamma/tau
VAERFSEEDLARFMQIMLRTHGELGYKQEQRFHLELGLLKLVHAQRLLPLEELLSGEAAQAKPGAAGGSASRATASGSRTVPSATRTSARTDDADAPSSRAPAASPFTRPSPFEADRQRKSEPKAEAQGMTSVRAAGDASSAATASSMESMAVSSSTAIAVATEPETPEETSPSEITIDVLRNAVLSALEEVGQHVLAHNLEEGEWALRGVEIAVTVGMSQVLIDVALGPEPKRIITAALSKAAGRPLKFKMVSGKPAAAKSDAPPRPANGVGARGRALADPIVQRMQEKFGAEIRTVIDQKNSG